MEKKCPFCGELLPEEAAFCPRCAKSVNQRDPAKKPRPTAAKILKWILPFFLAAAVLAIFFLYSRPKTYEGMGSVTYTDKEGSYQLLLHYLIDQRYSPLAEFETVAGTEERYRFPPLALCQPSGHRGRRCRRLYGKAGICQRSY